MPGLWREGRDVGVITVPGGHYLPCRIPHCPILVSDHSGFCDDHGRERRMDYDARRGKTAERGYDETWRHTRDAKLRQDPYCELQIRCQPRTPAEEVHHVIPISQRPELRLVMSNLQSTCKSCHSALEPSWGAGQAKSQESLAASR